MLNNDFNYCNELQGAENGIHPAEFAKMGLVSLSSCSYRSTEVRLFNLV